MLPELCALRVRAAIRRGSSWPVLVHTARGDFVTKLRGAAQGLAPLVAEIIVGGVRGRALEALGAATTVSNRVSGAATPSAEG